MIWDVQPKPWNRGRFELAEDYATAIHRIGADLGADDAWRYLVRLPRLRAAAVEADDLAFVAEADRIQGVLVGRAGDGDRARGLLADAREAFLWLEEWLLAAQAVADTAEIAYQESELLQAACLYDEAAELAVREPDPALDDAARYSGHAAQCHLESGDHGQATRRYRIAIDLALRADDPGQAAVWSHDLGNTLERVGDEDGALEQFLRAVELDPNGDTASPVWSRISQVYRSQGRTGPAREAAQRAMATAHNADATRDARYHALALAAEYEPAMALLEELRALGAEYLADRNPRPAAHCRVIEAGLLHRAGRTSEAERAWDEASAVVAAEQDWGSLAGFHAERAGKLAESRDAVGARHHLTLAIELYERVNLSDNVAMCRRNLSALDAVDDPQVIREQWRDPRELTTREEAHEVLGLAGVEFALQRLDRAAELADRCLAFFLQQRLQHSELEARTLLAAVHTQCDRPDRAAEHLHALLAATESGMYPTIRAQALTIVGAAATAHGQFGPAAAAYRAAIDVLEVVADTGGGASALARLNLAVVTFLTDPEEALRHASAASAAFLRQGHIGYAARADLAAAIALTRIGSWQGAFDLAVPALLVTDILRAATASARDRNRMREVWSMVHHQVLEILVEIDDPRLTAEVLERLRANATAPEPASTPNAVDGLALPVGAAAPVEDGSAITWDAQWSAGGALLDGDHQLAIGLPPLVEMPWGVALEPYETIAAHRLLGMSERHRRARRIAQWVDQIGFA